MIDYSSLNLNSLGGTPTGLSKEPPTEYDFKVTYKGDLIPNRKFESLLQYAENSDDNKDRFGIDILTRETWVDIPTSILEAHNNLQYPVLFLLFVPKTSSKIDLFTRGKYTTRVPNIYNSTNNEVCKLAYAAMAGKETDLLPVLKDVEQWNLLALEGEHTINFNVQDVTSMFQTNATIKVGKVKTKGENAGEVQILTRTLNAEEGCRLYALDFNPREEEVEEEVAVEEVTEMQVEAATEAESNEQNEVSELL